MSALQQDITIMLGLTLGGRYQVLRVLGAGSFGYTYLALDTHRPDSPQCVVKHLRPSVADAGFWPLAQELFSKEAHVLEKLGTHDQIPRLLAYFEQDQNFYLVQEYVAGDIVSQLITPGHVWSLNAVQELLADILHVLVFVHDCGVIHRDIKPSNLIQRQSDGKFILIDFGAVKSIQALWGSPNSSSATAAYSIGTPGYMPPEQSQGRTTPNSDLYALGMVALQALTGLAPTQLQFNDRGEWDWEPFLKTPTPAGMARWLQKLVAYSNHDRCATAQDALSALKRLTSPSPFQRVIQILQTPVQELTPWSKADAGRSPRLEPEKDLAPTDGQPILPHRSPVAPDGHLNSVLKPYSLSVFISYRPFDVETQLAQALEAAFRAADIQVYKSGQPIGNGSESPSYARKTLQSCQVFIVLLSPQAVNSELLLEELRTIHHLVSGRSQPQPLMIPIRIDLPLTTSLNFEMRGYLQRLQQRMWQSSQPIDTLVTEIVERVKGRSRPSAPPAEPLSGGLPIPLVVVQPEAPPAPVAEPELPEGQLRTASVFYIERPPIEQQCAETIQLPGALVRIKAPRQMGKTSLMARLLYQATQQGYQAVSLNLQLTDRAILTDLNQLLRWMCASISRRLQQQNRVQDHWDDLFGSKYNCTTYFEEYLLPDLDAPMVLALDEVDRVFTNPEVASDFFGLLRAWHEEAKNQDLWSRLRLIVVHATEVYIPLNIQQSPFNVGLPIELPEFNATQVKTLLERHSLSWSDRQVEQLMSLIGGHPYLTRLALYHIARGDVTLEHLLQTASDETGLFRDHLAGQAWKLQQLPDLALAMQQVLRSTEPVVLDPTQRFQLQSLGLVKLSGDRAQLRYELYRRYFQSTR